MYGGNMLFKSRKCKEVENYTCYFLPCFIAIFPCYTMALFHHHSGPAKRVTQFKYLGCTVWLAFPLRLELLHAGTVDL